MPELTRQQQEAESFSRAQERGTAAPEPVTAPPADTATPEPIVEAAAPAPVQADPEAPPVPRAPPRSAGDGRRADIVARFRDGRTNNNDAADDVAEINAFANQGLPPELVPAPPAPPAPVVAVASAIEDQQADPEAPPVPRVEAPAKRKVVVRGQTLELTDEEILAAAQKGLAGDDYFAEAKRKLDEVNVLLRDTKTRAAPSSPDATHPGAPAPGQTAEQPTPPADPAHPGLDLSQVVEQIQFGDPAKAAELLAQAISTSAANSSQETLQNERLRNESARSQRFLKEFEGENPELADDPIANAAIERLLYDFQRDDLVKLMAASGVEESKVPTNPNQIAKWHLYYRTEGHPVRDVPTLLKEAAGKVKAWKGTTADPPPAPAPTPAPPRIEVAVDRSKNRASIPQQPSRTVAPRPDAVTQPAPPRDRSSVVQGVMAQRSKLRGRMLGV